MPKVNVEANSLEPGNLYYVKACHIVLIQTFFVVFKSNSVVILKVQRKTVFLQIRAQP